MNDSASGASANERDSMYKDDNDDSDFDEATFNTNFNGVVRESLPPNVSSNIPSSASMSGKFNGSNKLDADDNFDSLSEQSRHSE